MRPLIRLDAKRLSGLISRALLTTKQLNRMLHEEIQLRAPTEGRFIYANSKFRIFVYNSSDR